jgi:hypothetical protein
MLYQAKKAATGQRLQGRRLKGPGRALAQLARALSVLLLFGPFREGK